jgi:hypothetical protein
MERRASRPGRGPGMYIVLACLDVFMRYMSDLISSDLDMIYMMLCTFFLSLTSYPSWCKMHNYQMSCYVIAYYLYYKQVLEVIYLFQSLLKS